MKKVLLFFCAFFACITPAFADINLVVSPFKYEIQAERGETVTKSAKIINKGNESVTLSIESANFVSDNTSGKPIFVKDASGTKANANTELASWITYPNETFQIGALETKEISFDVTIPADASPGGHYGAVFFTYTGTTGSQVNIKADYGVLLLVQVAGEIDDNTISNGSKIHTPIAKDYEQYLANIQSNTDTCIVDMTGNNVDGRCIDTLDTIADEAKDIYDNIVGNDTSPSQNTPTKNTDIPFEIRFPFENTGNTHTTPTGKVTITDEHGKNINNIGKEYVYDENNNIIGEKIVDYIPINQEEGSILPGTKRDFIVKADGILSSKDGTDDFTITSFSQHFGVEESEKKHSLFPWEQYVEQQRFKNLTINAQLGYTNVEGEDIEFNSAQDFTIPYTTKVVGINYYFFVFLALFLILAWIIIKLLWWVFKNIFFFLIGKRKICPKCKKRVEKDMQFCPHCGTELDTKEKTKQHTKKSKNA